MRFLSTIQSPERKLADTRLELAWALDSRVFGQGIVCAFAETQAED